MHQSGRIRGRSRICAGQQQGARLQLFCPQQCTMVAVVPPTAMQKGVPVVWQAARLKGCSVSASSSARWLQFCRANSNAKWLRLHSQAGSAAERCFCAASSTAKWRRLVTSSNTTGRSSLQRAAATRVASWHCPFPPSTQPVLQPPAAFLETASGYPMLHKLHLDGGAMPPRFWAA